MKTYLAILSFFAYLIPANADSPLTSTEFYLSYLEYDMVQYASEVQILDDKIAAYLLDNKNLLDVKAAVINALGWNFDGKKDAELFKNYLAKKYHTTPEKLPVKNLNGQEQMCLGYMMAMDNYFDVTNALEIMESAKAKMPTSYTVNMLYSLVKSEKDFNTDFCAIWKNTKEVLDNKSLKRDFKTQAAQTIVNYTILYREYCYYKPDTGSDY